MQLKTVYAAAVLIFIMALAGCSKNNGSEEEEQDDPSKSYVNFKADNVQKEYKTNALSQVLPISPKQLYSCVIQGYQDYPSVADRNLISIVIWSEEPITTKTYKNNKFVANSDGDKVPEVLISYFDNDKNSYLSMAPPVSPIPPFDKIVSDVQLTITSITENRITGSFSGTLHKTTDATYTIKVMLDEGKFGVVKY